MCRRILLLLVALILLATGCAPSTGGEAGAGAGTPGAAIGALFRAQPEAMAEAQESAAPLQTQKCLNALIINFAALRQQWNIQQADAPLAALDIQAAAGNQVELAFAGAYRNEQVSHIFAQIAADLENYSRRYLFEGALTEEMPDSSLRITDAEGNLLYEFFGSVHSPVTGQLNRTEADEAAEPCYCWYAKAWPQAEQPFAFLCVHGAAEPEQTQLELLTAEAQAINGIAAFAPADILALREPWGFTLLDCLSVVNSAHRPLQSEAHLSATQTGFELRHQYAFGSLAVPQEGWCQSVTLSNALLPGPRGLSVGDSFKQVLNVFPVQQISRGESAGWQTLYRLDQFNFGEIYFDAHDQVTEIVYRFGFPPETQQQAEQDALQGYLLRFGILDEQISSIQLEVI